MDTYFYLLVVEGDCEPTVEGPFCTEDERDSAAKEYRKAEFDGGIYPLDVSAEVEPIVAVDSYPGEFLDLDDEIA